MKKNAALREFKKLKSQINQIEEIVHHSKIGALVEQETRKTLPDTDSTANKKAASDHSQREFFLSSE